MKLYIYQASDVLSYKRNRLDTLGLYLKYNDLIHQTGFVRPHTSDPMTDEYVEVINKFMDLLENSWTEDEYPTISVYTITSNWLLKAFATAGIGDDAYVPPKSDAAKKCVERLRQSKFTFEVQEMDLANTEDFAGDVAADSVADSAVANYDVYGKTFLANIRSEKQLRKKVSPNHPLIVDNLVIDRLRNDGVYYCGIGDLTKRAPKKDQNANLERKKASHVYFTGNNNRLRNFGMYSANERYHVVILKDTIPYLDKLFAFQREINKGIHQVQPETVFRIKEVTGAGVNALVSEGDFTGIGVTETGDLYSNTIRRTDLSYVMNPARLKMRVMRQYDWAEEILLRFISGDDTLHVTEVTDMFYITDTKGKPAMNPDRNVQEDRITFEDVAYEGGTTKIIALGKVTMPTYQEFKRWTKLQPRVWIYTRKVEEHLLRYSFIIETELGHLHYTCPYGGVKVLRKASKKARG